MKILQLIDSLSAGGAERMAVNISNVLVKAGHQTWLCSTRRGGPLKQFVDSSVNYRQLNKRHGLDPGAFVKLVKLIRNNKIEIIHAHSSSVFWAVATKLVVPGTKVIWHDHLGKRIEEVKLNRIIIIIISSGFDGVISVNDELKRWSQKKLKIPASKIVFINNFPFLSEPNPLERKSEGILQIVCLANLRKQKDHITLIKAVDILVHQHRCSNFKVILAGHYFEDEYFRQVTGEIEARKLEVYFDIVGSVSDTASLLYTSNIGVLSSASEGLPVSLLEYGLAGLPVVVTDVGQCAEVVANGKAGLVVPPSAPEQLAASLLELLIDAKKRADLGAALKERVGKEYGAGKFLDDYMKLTDKVLG